MPSITFSLFGRGRRGVASLIGVLIIVLVAVILVEASPGLLLGSSLAPNEAETIIRGRLLAEATRAHYGDISLLSPNETQEKKESYEVAVQPVTNLEFESVEVATSVFGMFRIARRFVTQVVMRDQSGERNIHYYCFSSKVLLGECSKWNWYFAW